MRRGKKPLMKSGAIARERAWLATSCILRLSNHGRMLATWRCMSNFSKNHQSSLAEGEVQQLINCGDQTTSRKKGYLKVYCSSKKPNCLKAAALAAPSSRMQVD